MSRTDKTAPYWVKVEGAANRLVEHHDHRQGDCTLPADRTAWVGVIPPLRGCAWVVPPSFDHDRENSCGCGLCTGHHSRREQRRRSRHEARSSRRAWLLEY